MQVNYYVLLTPFIIELISYIFYGPYIFNIKIIEDLIKDKKITINQFDANMISIHPSAKAYICKKNNFLWEWYVVFENGKRMRVFRWTKSSNFLDELFNKLNQKK